MNIPFSINPDEASPIIQGLGYALADIRIVRYKGIESLDCGNRLVH